MSRRGILTAVFGASGTGKGVWVISQIKRKKISLVWDIKAARDEYPCQYRCFNIRDLSWLIVNIKKGMICYSGKEKDFDAFCEKAKLFAEKFGKDAALVIDETSDVTNPGKARGSYGNLIRTGLCHSTDFYVMCQRGAESDKTAIGNSSRLHFSAMTTADDSKGMAKLSGVPLSEVLAVRRDDDNLKFEYIDVVRGQFWEKGLLSFPGGKPSFKKIKSKKFSDN